MTKTLNIIKLNGIEVTPYVTSIAKLEMKVLREYPYLYEVDLPSQISYVKRFAECEKSIVVLVMDGSKIVGLSTGIPLSFDTEPFKKPFTDNGMNVDDVFYFGESLLLSEYRGQSIYRQFFAKREMEALKQSCSICAFVSVERLLDDDRKPANYVSLDAVWQHFGYEKHPELSFDFEWQDVGESVPSKKKFVYWIKRLCRIKI